MSQFSFHFVKFRLQFCLVLPIAFALVGASLLSSAGAQTKTQDQKKRLASIRGKIAHTGDFSKANVQFSDIKTSLHQKVTPPPVPIPGQWPQMNVEDRQLWLKAFQESDQGKKFFEDRQKLIRDAKVFEVVFDDSGEFVVFDVPEGTYGLQGRVDKEVDGVTHAFEAFAEIVVGKDIEVVNLKPIPIVTTPLFKQGQPAPAITVDGQDGSLTFDDERFKGKHIFLNFWYSGDPDNGYQKQVYEMYEKLKEKNSLELISIAIDSDRKNAVNAIKQKKLSGAHGFSDGWEHKIVESYGVRSTPSGWLISPDRKIMMTQHEFFQAIRVTPSIEEVIGGRIEGKDKPTPAIRKEIKGELKVGGTEDSEKK